MSTHIATGDRECLLEDTHYRRIRLELIFNDNTMVGRKVGRTSKEMLLLSLSLLPRMVKGCMVKGRREGHLLAAQGT